MLGLLIKVFWYGLIDNIAYFWIILALLFLLMEMGSPGLFFFIAFSCGGMGAAISTLWVSTIMCQMTVFFAVTVVSLILLQRYMVPKISKGRPQEHTNVYALRGKQGFVIEGITGNLLGMVKINGETWGARSVHGDTIEEGSLVEVIEIRGTHLIVKKVK